MTAAPEAIGRGWWGRELAGADPAWRLTLTPEAVAALVAVGRELGLAGAIGAVRAADGGPRPPLPADALAPLAPLIADVRARLAGFPGFVLVRGFPVGELPEEELSAAYLAFGACLGRPISQRTDGAMLARVEDVGADISVPTQRGHQSAAELPFHVDRTDVIGLLCVRPAAEGGESRLASAWAIHDHLATHAPEALAALFEPIAQDRRGEQRQGQPPWSAIPVFARVDGRPVSRYVPRFIADAQRFEDAPALSARQREALAHVAALLEEPGTTLDMRLAPGDLQLIDNYAVWHSRAAFRDLAGGGRRGRLLLRLWLATPDSPPLPPAFADLYGATATGVLRGGVWPQDAEPPLGAPVTTLLG